MVSKPRSFRRVLPAFGLAAIASVLLGVFVSSAMAEPEPPPYPVNPRPAVSGSLTLGGTITTTNGTWSNNPTSFSYAWVRCNGAGEECATIAGATSSSYKIVTADIGHKLKSAVTATNSGGSTTEYSSLTGYPSAAQHWYYCKYVGKGEGTFEDAACSKALGGGAYRLKMVEAPTGFTLAQAPGTALSMKFQPNGYAISCASQKAEGTVSNPTGGGAGTLVSSTSLVLGECTVTFAPHCALSSGSLSVPISAEVTEFEGKPAVKFSTSGFTVTFVSSGGLCQGPTTYEVNGTFTAVENSSTATYEYSNAANNLEASKRGVTLEGTNRLATSAGSLLKLAP